MIKNGSYDSVVSCAVCGTELSREHKVLNATGHDFGDWIETTKVKQRIISNLLTILRFFHKISPKNNLK